ncbi:MAG TPA: SWIM zinc finger family protein, partial [Armatimonadota bacterium]|nr:SWIM zinc finger family protein [Armatimonadota bacterium]
MPSWTPEQILALAPDPSSAKSGRDLGAPRKWQTLGTNERAAWGLCQGSGKNPYQTQIDLGEPAFRCSCPSRKFPCKHGLGLFLVLSAQPAAFTETSPPDWVTAWLETRSQRQEQRAERAEARAKGEATGADPDAQAKRAAEREQKVAGGLDELERWLEDIIRRGLAEVQTQPTSFWDGIASRMVDAQAPGLARLVREASAIPAGGEGWPARLLERLARIHLLIEGYRRLDTLPEETQADIRTRIGWNVREEELLQGETTVDRWLILGQRTEMEERLRVQRTWMVGEESSRAALLLQFAHGSAPMDASLVPGSRFRAALVFYPGAAPLRAALKERLSP